MKNSKEDILLSCNSICKNTLMETLEIEFIDVTEDTLIAKMDNMNQRIANLERIAQDAQRQ